MTTARRIAKNTIVLFIAQITSYLLGFFITMYTARYLGVAGFGIISIGISITGIYGVFADMGLSTLIIRDIARDKTFTNKYITNIAIIRVLLVILMVALVAITVNLIGYNQVTTNVIYLLTLSTIITAFGSILTSVFQANEKMEYLSINIVFNSVLMLAGTLIGIYYHFNVIYFASVYVFSSSIILVQTLLIYFWKFSIPKIEFDRSFWKPKIKEAWPFGVTALFMNIYFLIDSVLLSIMVGTTVVGWYSAAYKLIVVLLFVPIVLNVVTFPVMSKFYVTSKESLRLAYEKYFKYATIIGIPIGVGTTLLADKIIPLIYGTQFIPSVIALQILVWSAVLIFMSSAFARLLEVTNKQLVLTKITVFNAVINIILNILLIPKYSYIAASFVTVFTELSSLLLLIKVVSSMGYQLSGKDLSAITKVVVASSVMAVFIIFLKNWNLFLLILTSTIIYTITLILIKGLDDEDIKIFRSILGK